jgi:hypothetical protein
MERIPNDHSLPSPGRVDTLFRELRRGCSTGGGVGGTQVYQINLRVDLVSLRCLSFHCSVSPAPIPTTSSLRKGLESRHLESRPQDRSKIGS